MAKRLILIRHGESEGNFVKNQMRHDDDVHAQLYGARHTSQLRLTPRGRDQLIATGRWLSNHFELTEEDVYITTEYARARESAALLGIPSAKWQLEYRLVERDWGDIERVPHGRRTPEQTAHLAHQKLAPFYWRPVGGETTAELRRRVTAAVRDACIFNIGKTITIVAHGEVMTQVRMDMEGMPVEAFDRFVDAERPKDDVIFNGEVHVYDNLLGDPSIGDGRPTFSIFRPSEPVPQHGAVRPICPVRYSNEELLAGLAAYYPPFLPPHVYD
jgi:broad specificity phosphatase PhoE